MMSHVAVNPAALKRTKPAEYITRFVFGGAVTAVAGLIAHYYGPVVGGLFLAFPAIFPASCTLVEKHEDEHQDKDGEHHERMGMKAAGVDAAGASLGSVGMIGFGLVVWLFAPAWPAWLMLSAASAVWFLISVLAWQIRQRV